MATPGRDAGRRAKPLEEGLNLVPYIDLLTCMIAFLLITAVWTQLARLEVSQRGPHGDQEAGLPQTRMTVLVAAEGFDLIVAGDRQPFPRVAGSYDFAGLTLALAKVKQTHPDKDDAVVASEDRIDFGTLVGTMDAVLAAGFPAVSLEPAAP